MHVVEFSNGTTFDLDQESVRKSATSKIFLPQYHTIKSSFLTSTVLFIGKCYISADPEKDIHDTFPNNPWFLRVCSTSLLKTLREKEKMLIMSNFSFSQCVFHPFGKLSAIFIKFEIVVWKLLQFGRV